MKTINIPALSAAMTAMNNCTLSGMHEMAEIWDNYILSECDKLPSGSGIDNGMHLIREECEKDKITFYLDFHHLNENGYYDGWTSHKVVIRPAFGGIDIRITGRDRNQIKEYLYDFMYSLFDGSPAPCPIINAQTTATA